MNSFNKTFIVSPLFLGLTFTRMGHERYPRFMRVVKIATQIKDSLKIPHLKISLQVIQRKPVHTSTAMIRD